MNNMERMVWAAAFAAEFAKERKFRDDHQVAHLPLKGISGFSCAEIADMALEKYREAITCDDAEYLIPVKETWEK